MSKKEIKYKNVAMRDDKHRSLAIKAARAGKTIMQYVIEKCEL